MQQPASILLEKMLKAIISGASFLLIIIFMQACRTTPPAAPEVVVEKEPTPAVVDKFEVEGLETTTTDSGIKYILLEPGSGMELEHGMYVTLHYTGFIDEEAAVFDSSRERGEPITFILGRRMVIPGWEEAIPNFRVGDKVRLWIPSHLAYGDQGRGPIPPDADLIFDLEILDATALVRPEPFNTKGLDTLETESGLQYIIIREGYGDYPEAGQVVVIHYTGYLSDGTMIDSSVQRNEPLRFVVGSDQVIRGMDEGLALLRQNSRARLIIPPDLAYGERGVGPVPPDATLIFDIELIYIE